MSHSLSLHPLLLLLLSLLQQSPWLKVQVAALSPQLPVVSRPEQERGQQEQEHQLQEHQEQQEQEQERKRGA